MSVFWTPFAMNRRMDADGDNFIFVYLQDASGDPVTGVVEGDLATLTAIKFEEQSLVTEVPILGAMAAFTGSWAEVGAAFPGLYHFRIDADPWTGGSGQAYFALTLTADPTHTYMVSVTTSGGSDGGNGDFDPGLFVGLLGYNTKYAYTSFDSGGRPLVGTMTVYPTRADAVAETNALGVVDLQYVYENGRLVEVKKLIDTSSFEG